MNVERGCNAVIYLGNVEVESVSVNGTQLSGEQINIDNLMLTIDKDLLTKDVNEIVINGNKTITVIMN